jgi:hypothetical protein
MGAIQTIQIGFRTSAANECEPSSNSGKFLFCAPGRFRVSAEILYHAPHVLIRLFEFHGGFAVRFALEKNLCANAMSVQRLLEHGAK